MQADRTSTRPPPRWSRPTTLLYARPGIVVTTERFTAGRSSYAVADLTHLRTGRGPHDRLAARIVTLAAVGAGTAGVLLGFTGGLERLTAGAYLGLGVVCLLPVLLVLLGDRWRPPAHELHGHCHGTELLLFSSDDREQFDQVVDALHQAREQHRYPDADDPSPTTRHWRPTR
ncbi:MULTISPECIES: DUF6232 family protein [unclassified Micromonospora]|uniref:DUF6232 family protein n=1 Tax=unclassified Micromonospora TaxID=2617518 RepID=UPI001C5DA752|nr:DUF6232 family protein [Micromonospora sp. RL09-050-HVF-A]MBW4702839.1 hypothetical protein [Micromonospora sp. RL09-050-HVF-A]